ncbi:unnamed protein product, partial [Rotaria magnacalcarata]
YFIFVKPVYPPSTASSYPPVVAPPYPQQPLAPSTSGQPPAIPPDGSALPYPTAYMQPFFPMPPGYNPYNPFFNMSEFIKWGFTEKHYSIVCLVAPPY